MSKTKKGILKKNYKKTYKNKKNNGGEPPPVFNNKGEEFTDFINKNPLPLYPSLTDKVKIKEINEKIKEINNKFTELFTFKYLKLIKDEQLLKILIDYNAFFNDKILDVKKFKEKNDEINKICFVIVELLKQNYNKNEFKPRSFLKDILNIYINSISDDYNVDKYIKELLTIICKLNNKYSTGWFSLEQLQENINDYIEDFKQNSPNQRRNTNINIKLFKQNLQDNADIDDYLIKINKNGQTYADNFLNIENSFNEIIDYEKNKPELVYENNIEISRKMVK